MEVVGGSGCRRSVGVAKREEHGKILGKMGGGEMVLGEMKFEFGG